MANIGVLGGGIGGLHLALLLQQRDVPVTLYTDRTPEQWRASNLPSTVIRYTQTLERERALGVQHWEGSIASWSFYAHAKRPLGFLGRFPQCASVVDMREYHARLLEDYLQRGGNVTYGHWTAGEVAALCAPHDLIVVAAGRAGLTELFRHVPEHSPYSTPPRRIAGGLFHGVQPTEPKGFRFNTVPGVLELFETPVLTAQGTAAGLVLEVIPDHPLASLSTYPVATDPGGFARAMLQVVREHFPDLHARIDESEFALTRPSDALLGAVTPAVREGFADLGNGKYAVALGDVRATNDPVTGQGANVASSCAQALADLIVGADAFGEAFCVRVDERLWSLLEPVTAWTNDVLRGPTPHRTQLIVACARDPRVADAYVELFDAPDRMWNAIRSSEGVAAFLSPYAYV